MSVKVILDGALFSECEMMGSNRSGMLRLTEDITRNLIEESDVDIYFANTVYSLQSDLLLRKFINENYSSHRNRVVSRTPLFASNIPKLSGILRRISSKLSFKTYISGLGGYDVFHSFYYPFSEQVQKRKIKKSITYLDIIPLRLDGYPHSMIQATKRVIDSLIPNYGIAISQFSKDDLVDYDRRVDPDRIFVAPLAASMELFFQNKDMGAWGLVRKKYGLPENYFLSVSSSDERKNLRHLIRSFSKFILQQRPKDLFLVLTGNFMHSYSILDEMRVNEAVRAKIIITQKYIDNEDLALIYTNALSFFFMSLYEGFGLPVLEAMQCGTPVVTSNSTSLPEIVNDSGIMLSPIDEDALSSVMNDLYLDRELREKYSALGLIRSKNFSWQRCAAEYARIFKTIT